MYFNLRTLYVIDSVEDGFEAWFSGEPNNLGDAENCVVTIPFWDYEWADKACSATYEYICELRKLTFGY